MAKARKSSGPPKKAPPKKKAQAQKKKPPKSPAAISGLYLLIPGGFRHKERVFRAPKKSGIYSVDMAHFQDIHPSHAALARSRRLEGEEGFIADFGPPTAATLNPNWVAYAGWRNTTGAPIVHFEANYIVPPAPQNDFQTIFIFIGLQNANHILQPVLQFGVSGVGGGAYWSAASFFAGGQSSPAMYSNLVGVQPGQPLTAVIEAMPNGGGTLNYRCSFAGYNATLLTVSGVPEMAFCCGTLESYHVNNNTDYPSSPFAAITNVQVRNTAGVMTVPWQISPNRGRLGEHAVVNRQPNLDRIELHFSNV